MTLSMGELVLRVCLAAALGGLIGIERELSDQPAGFRTHMLVSVGAALFTLAGAFGLEDFIGGEVAAVRFDPTRVAAQVVTGIGFLGAGAIMHKGVNVRGLTTAAALWVTAAIGTSIGLGYVSGAVIATVVSLLILYGMKVIERLVLARLKRGRVRFVLDVEPSMRLTALSDAIESSGGEIDSIKVFSEEREGRRLVVTTRIPSDASARLLAADLERVTGVAAVDTSP